MVENSTGILAFDYSSLLFTAEADDENLIGEVKPYQISAEFAAYPSSLYGTVSTGLAASTLVFEDPCLDPFVFTASNQVNPSPATFDGVAIEFSLNEFTMDPSICEVTYECDFVVSLTGATQPVRCSDFDFDGIMNGDATDGKMTFSATADDYIDNVLEPGQYLVWIKGTAVGSDPVQTQSAFFTMTLLDPCDPPTSVGTISMDNEEYTITAAAIPKVHEAFPIEPSYCEIEYSLSETALFDASGVLTSASSYSDPARTVTISYTQDLAPLTQT